MILQQITSLSIDEKAGSGVLGSTLIYDGSTGLCYSVV